MSQFIIRVELHGLAHSHSSYTELHEAMEGHGYSRTIESSDNILYHLPPAEYNIIGSFTLSNVLDNVKVIVQSITSNNSILVSEINQASWYNLKKV